MKRCNFIILFLIGFSLFFDRSVKPNNLINCSFRRVRNKNLRFESRAHLYSIYDQGIVETWIFDDLTTLITEHDWQIGRFQEGLHPLLGGRPAVQRKLYKYEEEIGALEAWEKLANSLIFREFKPELVENFLKKFFTGINRFLEDHLTHERYQQKRYNVEEEVNRYQDILTEHIVSGSIIPSYIPYQGDNYRISERFAQGLRNVNSLSALFGISVNDFIKAIAPNPTRWKETPLGQRVLELAEFEQLIQVLKDKGIISLDIDYQDYYPIYLRNYFAFPDACQVETDEILLFLEDLFSGNITTSTERLYPDRAEALLPPEVIPGELTYIREMREKSLAELIPLLDSLSSVRIYSAAEILRRATLGLTSSKEIKRINLVDKIASLNFAWDLLPTPVSEVKREERIFQSIVLSALREITEILDLEKPEELLRWYCATMDPTTYIVTTIRHPIVNIQGQFVKIKEVNRWVENQDTFYTYHGVDIYGNPVNFIDEYSPADLRGPNGYRILAWDGYIWPEELFGPGAFTSEYPAI